MGLDISVIRTPKNIDLEAVYAIREAIESGYDWYLGDDKDSRSKKWVELKDKCRSLTKQDVLAHISEPKDLVKCINDMTDSDFNIYLCWIVSSISPHQDGNTHLNFDYDKLPGRTIFDARSWNLKDLFTQCEVSGKTERPCGDSILEVDPDKVCVMWKNWRRMSFKISLSKWIGYFSERVGFNILQDCLEELGVKDTFVGSLDVKWYMKYIGETAKATMDEDCRLWLVSSY